MITKMVKMIKNTCCLYRTQILNKSQIIIKNVSSSTSHKKLRLSVFMSFRLSLREFKKILPNTFIYESILIEIYMNTKLMNTQIFYLNKYDIDHIHL